MPNFMTVKEWSELVGVKQSNCNDWLDTHGAYVRNIQIGKRMIRFVELGEIEAICASSIEACERLQLLQLATQKNKRPRKERDEQEESEERVMDGVKVAKRRGK